MKIFLIFAALCILPLIGFSKSPTEELWQVLDEAEIKKSARPPLDGDYVVDPNYFKDIQNIAPSNRAQLAAHLAVLTPLMAKELSEQVVPRGGSELLLAILILQEFGTDQQKIEAFADLNIYGNSFISACMAVATCDGPEGVRILKKNAEDQFSILKADVRKEDDRNFAQGQTAESSDVKMYHCIIALSGALHPDGPVTAAKLYEEFIEFSESRLEKNKLNRVKEDFEKNMATALEKREILLKNKQKNNEKNVTQANASNAKEAPRGGQPTTSKWLWLGTSFGTILLLLTGCVIMSRKSASP